MQRFQQHLLVSLVRMLHLVQRLPRFPPDRLQSLSECFIIEVLFDPVFVDAVLREGLLADPFCRNGVGEIGALSEDAAEDVASVGPVEVKFIL